MSSPSDSRPAGSAVLFTNGDTSYEFFRDLGEGRVGERILLARTRTPKGLGDCVVLKCLPVPKSTDAKEKYPFRSADVEQAAQGLSVPLRDILHTMLRRSPAERFGTAAELEVVLRAQLARLGPSAREDALREIQRALADASEGLWDFEVPSDEGGITLPVPYERGGYEATTESPSPRGGARRASAGALHPDEVPTEPGAGPRRALTKQPAV